MNKTKIEWTNYSWNPMTGCKHECSYCYAKRIANRFGDDFTPKFHSERLDEPSKLKTPAKIFVCSMADMFGDWVDDEFITYILGQTWSNPQHIFQLLTKNPKRMMDIAFAPNVWTGITITGLETNAQAKVNMLKKVHSNFKFISFEPLMGPVAGLNLDGIDLVIFGAMTGPKAIAPMKEWLDQYKKDHSGLPMVFYKNNIKEYL